MLPDARAFWISSPGRGEIRAAGLPERGPDDVLVRTLHSAVSRGTESLVLRGGVPDDQRDAMRAPFQEGDFPAPVKYGYLNVGRVEAGPDGLRGQTVFCLYPHQTAYVVPAASVVPVPRAVPARRAVLAGLVETAVNALWDAAPLIGDRVAVVGAGALGCCVARLLVRLPGVSVQLCDTDGAKADVAARIGVDFRTPRTAEGGCDVVFHTSATGDGLQLALRLLADEARVHDLGWYGDRPVRLDLGGRFHSARLGIVSSQVGRVAPARRDRRTPHERLAIAVDLLHDPAFDELLTGESAFDDLPEVLPLLADGTLPAVCHTIRYPEVG